MMAAAGTSATAAESCICPPRSPDNAGQWNEFLRTPCPICVATSKSFARHPSSIFSIPAFRIPAFRRCSFELPLLRYAVCSCSCCQIPGHGTKGGDCVLFAFACRCSSDAVAPPFLYFFFFFRPRKFAVDRRRMLAARLFAKRFVCACQIQTFAYFARLSGTINRHHQQRWQKIIIFCANERRATTTTQLGQKTGQLHLKTEC